MVGIIIIMSFVIAALFVFIIMLSSMIGGLNKQLVLLDKEQHQQNKEIIELMKYRTQSSDMLLQHIEILKYLCDQDPAIGKKVMYTGPIGEA
jgi:Tfp pilus assembly protein PilN